jgi:FkbM family methyltransferase
MTTSEISDFSNLIKDITFLLSKNQLVKALVLYNQQRPHLLTVDELSTLDAHMARLKKAIWIIQNKTAYINEFLRINQDKIAFYRQFISAGDVSFDIGANVGNRSIIFNHLGARVIAVDPQPSCIEALTTIFFNDSTVTIVPQGVAEATGMVDMQICDHISVVSSMSKKWITEGRFKNEYQKARKISVPVTTLDALIVQYGMPSFCKIDVEGYELNVLQGLSSPIRGISFEYHVEMTEDTILCIKRLAEIGAYQFNVSPMESMTMHLEKWTDVNGICQLLNERRQELNWGDIYAKI